MHDRNGTPPTSGSTPPAPSEPSSGAQPSQPTTFLGAPALNNDTLTVWDDMPAVWRDAFGSNR